MTALGPSKKIRSLLSRNTLTRSNTYLCKLFAYTYNNYAKPIHMRSEVHFCQIYITFVLVVWYIYLSKYLYLYQLFALLVSWLYYENYGKTV